MKHLLLLFLPLLTALSLQAQDKPEPMDLVTLNNGLQLLGKIIEQHPGIDMKIYRPVENDTITVPLDSVQKISLLNMNRYADKQVDRKDTLLNIGRFNTKKNTYQVSFEASHFEFYPDEKVQAPDTGFYPSYTMQPRGLGFGYLRSIRNTFFWGGSIGFQLYHNTIFPLTGNKSHYSDDWSSGNFLLEGKVRLSAHPQQHRLTSLFGLGIGDQRIVTTRFLDEYGLNANGETQVTGHEKMSMMGNFLYAQASLSLKLNPDNNSGFCIEPIFSFCRPRLRTTYENYQDTPGLTVTVQHKYNEYGFSLRMSYFF